MIIPHPLHSSQICIGVMGRTSFELVHRSSPGPLLHTTMLNGMVSLPHKVWLLARQVEVPVAHAHHLITLCRVFLDFKQLRLTTLMEREGVRSRRCIAYCLIAIAETEAVSRS